MRITASRVGFVVVVLAASLPTPGLARGIRVDDPASGGITIKDGPTQPIQIDAVIVDPNSGAPVPVNLVKGASTGADGTYTNSGLNTGVVNSVDITIGGDHFHLPKGLTLDQIVVSDEETNKNPVAFPNIIVALGNSFSGATVVDGQLVTQFNLINSSTSSFAFTSLQVYRGLDTSFFKPVGFDSPAAIATGTLFYDAIASAGTLDLPAAGVAGVVPELTLPSGAGPSGGYELLTGTIEQFLGNGMFGPAIHIAIASEVVPAPSSIILMGTGLAAVLGHLRRRRVRFSRPS